MPTIAQFRKEILVRQARIAKLQAAIEDNEREIRFLEYFLDKFKDLSYRPDEQLSQPGLSERLRLNSSARKIGTMHTTPEPSRRPGRPIASDHPFPKALDEKGSNVAQWARDHKLDRAMVKSWYAEPPSRRRIPEKWAKLIEKELGVPLDAWKNGIR